MIWLPDSIMYAGGLFSGIICLESATYYHRISDFPPRPLMIYSEYPEILRAGYCVYIPVAFVNYEHTIHLANKLYVTDVYRTICDLIQYERGDDIVYQCMERFPDKCVLSDLLAYAAERGLDDRVKYYWDTVKNYYQTLEY